MCFFESTMYIWCTSSIKYLNSKPKVYMCHFINSRHKSQKCVVFVGDPLLGSLSWWCVWIRFGLPSTPTWTAPQLSRTQTCNSRLGPGQGSHLSAHISSKDKRWKCIGMHHKMCVDMHYALCMIDMVDFLWFSDHQCNLNHIDMFMNDSWMTINSINHSQKQQEEVCFYDGVPPIHVPPQTMTLQQIAENFFCAYFFGALSSTEDLPLDFESEDFQMNSQTRMKTVATANFHFYSFSLFKGLWYYRPVPSAAKVNCSYVSWPFRSKGGWGEVGRRRRYHCFLGSVTTHQLSSQGPPRLSASANRESSRCQMLSHRLIVNALQDRHCLMDYWFVFDLLLAPWPKGVRLCVCVWSTSVVRGVEMLHANFSPCWLFKLKKSGFRNRHLLSRLELFFLGADFGVDSIHQLGTRHNCVGIVWFISWVVGRLKWDILHRQFLSLKPWDAINCSRRPGDPHGGWNLGCSLDFQLLEPGWGGHNFFFNLQNDQISLIRLSATCHNLHRIWRMPWISTFFGSSALCLAFWCCFIVYLPKCMPDYPSI